MRSRNRYRLNELNLVYTPVWETLADALRRLVTAGYTELDAKLSLCAAIADKAVTDRLVLAEDTPRNLPESSVSATGLDLPERILPKEINWNLSRPIKPWPLAGQSLGEPMTVYLARVGHHLERTIETIEVRSSDVSRIFGLVTQAAPKRSQDAPRRQSGSGAKTVGIKAAIADLWPDGIPKGPSAKERNNQIVEWLRSHNLSVPKGLERAIQRALRKAD